jgi:hypothetical protein
MSEEREVDAEEIASTHASALAEVPYAVEEFAEKYGLSRKAADVILIASGPSRQKSDAGARAFLGAVAEFRRR